MKAMKVRVLSLIVGSLLPLGCGGGDNPVYSGGDNDQTGTPASVATTVTLSPTALSFTSFGETQQLTATVVDQNGTTMGSAVVTWESSAPSVASVSTTGLVTAVADGTATVTATSGSATGSASVTVVTSSQVATFVGIFPSTWSFFSFGGTQELEVFVLDQDGQLIIGAVVTWTSSSPAVASVSSTGLVTAVANGTATVTATSGSANATVSITVNWVLLQFQSVSAGASFAGPHSCGVTTAGAAHCWGSDGFGKLGTRHPPPPRQ